MKIPLNVRPGIAGGMTLAGSFGLFLALAFSLEATLRLLAGDSVPPRLGNVSFARLVLSYLVGGVVSGVLLDWLLPRTRRREEAAFAGFIAAVPFLGAIRIAWKGFTDWTVGDVARIALFSLVVGMVTAAHIWRRSSCRRSH